MLNNFFHDFSVALLFVALLALSYVYKTVRAAPDKGKTEFFQGFYAFFKKIIIIAWGWIIVGGAIRTWAYYDYEWLPAAGRGQIAALVVKHIMLLTFVVWGILMQIRLKRLMNDGTK